jgi:hypothetical protein
MPNRLAGTTRDDTPPGVVEEMRTIAESAICDT